MILRSGLLAFLAFTFCCNPHLSRAEVTDLKKTVKRLVAIAKTVERHEQRTAKLDYRIQGVSRFEVTGRRELPSTKPESFVYAARGNRVRYEHDWHMPHETIRCIELVDGTHYYRVNGKRVLVFPMTPPEQARREFGTLAGIRQPIYQGQGMSLLNRLNWFAEQLLAPDTAQLWTSGQREFSLNEQTDRITIRDIPGAGLTGETFELIIDPQHSNRAMKWRFENGSNHAQWHYTCQIEPQYHDVDENENFIVGGKIAVIESGTLVTGTSREGSTTAQIDAKVVETGSYEVPMDFFDAATLPPTSTKRDTYESP